MNTIYIKTYLYAFILLTIYNKRISVLLRGEETVNALALAGVH